MIQAELTAQVTDVLGTGGLTPWEDLAGETQARITAALADPAQPPVASPATPDQAAALLELAHRQGWRLLFCGSGHQLDWGGLGHGVDLVVSTAALNQVRAFAVGDLTVTVEAGTPLATLQATLQTQGQCLALDPTYPATSTLGGLMATGDGGALRQRYGTLRDMVIGVEFVRHDGQRAKAGGQVVKNVAGYDMMKLLHGSYGSLGLITQITLRTFPVQAAAQTVVLSGEGTALAPLISAIRASALTPVAWDLVSGGLATVAGASVCPALVLRFQATAAGVDEQVNRLLTLTKNHPAVTATVLADADEAALWTQLTAALGQDAITPDQPDPAAALLKVGVLPNAALAFCDRLDGASLARIHLGSGAGLVRLAGASLTPERIQQLRQWCTAHQGYLLLLRGPKSLKQQVDPWGNVGTTLPLMARLKAQFDPDGRLCPGRYVGGL